MGAWGINAWESDNGLDVIDFIEELYEGKDTLILSEIILACLDEGLMSIDEIDYLYDSTAMVLAELVVMFYENKKLDFDNEDDSLALNKKIDFKIDKKSIEMLLNQLLDIKDEKPDKDGIREFVFLWKGSSNSERWQAHLNDLIKYLQKEITKNDPK